MEQYTLIDNARNGDKEALVALIVARKQEYYRLAYVYMGNPHDALDALEDMIVALYENIKRLKNVKAFDTYSKTVLANCCKNILRKRKRVVPIDTIIKDSNDQSLEQKENQLFLETHLSQLKPKYQEALRLRYFLDLDYQSIAALTKVPTGTVKSRIFNGLKQLRERLGGEYLE